MCGSENSTISLPSGPAGSLRSPRGSLLRQRAAQCDRARRRARHHRLALNVRALPLPPGRSGPEEQFCRTGIRRRCAGLSAVIFLLVEWSRLNRQRPEKPEQQAGQHDRHRKRQHPRHQQIPDRVPDRSPAGRPPSCPRRQTRARARYRPAVRTSPPRRFVAIAVSSAAAPWA